MKDIKTKVIFKGLAVMAFTFFGMQAIAQEENYERGERPHPKERPTYAKVLEKLDANKDGKIAKSEAKGPLEHHFAEVDRNGDGFITESEFAKAPKPPKEKPTFDQVLSKLDTNKDGKIAQSEAKGPLEHHFKEIDTNGDGFISKAEFVKGAENSKRGAKKDCKKECKEKK